MGVRRGLGAVALALGLTAVGCSAVGSEPDVDLAGAWVLVSGRTAAGPLAMTPYTHVTLTFDEDTFGGKAPCNDYGADYELDGDSFDVPGDGIEQTLAGCGKEPEALESAYLDALTEVGTVAREGDTLAMTGADVELELRLRPFVRLGDSGGVGGRISASSGCRVLEGRWRVWRGAPHVTRSRWRGSCPERLMEQEMAVGNTLSEPVLQVRRRSGRTELVIRHAHANSPAELVYRG